MLYLTSAAYRLVVIGLLLTSLTVIASAQFRAGIQGSIADSTGAAISGATITITNLETTTTQKATSSADGFYRITGLAPGRYQVSAERAGFKKKVLESVVVNAEQVEGVNFALDAGDVSDTITVSGDTTPAVETENANVTRAVSEAEVRRLPQFGRDPYELVRLTPGVFGEGARSGSGGAVNLPNTTGPEARTRRSSRPRIRCRSAPMASVSPQTTFR